MILAPCANGHKSYSLSFVELEKNTMQWTLHNKISRNKTSNFFIRSWVWEFDYACYNLPWDYQTFFTTKHARGLLSQSALKSKIVPPDSWAQGNWWEGVDILHGAQDVCSFQLDLWENTLIPLVAVPCPVGRHRRLPADERSNYKTAGRYCFFDPLTLIYDVSLT